MAQIGGEMMPIFWDRTEQDKAEVKSWMAGGPITAAVQEACTRNGLTFCAVFTTRRYSGNYKNN